LFLTAALCCCTSISCMSYGDDITLQGAGATFPAPLYKRWFLEYYKKNPDVRVNYQAIGSGAGVRQFTEGLIQFGASDASMSDPEILKFRERQKNDVLVLPLTAGSVAISYNVPGAPKGLRISRKALLGIVLGQITNWSDRALTAANPGVTLPDLDITWI